MRTFVARRDFPLVIAPPFAEGLNNARYCKLFHDNNLKQKFLHSGSQIDRFFRRTYTPRPFTAQFERSLFL